MQNKNEETDDEEARTGTRTRLQLRGKGTKTHTLYDRCIPSAESPLLVEGWTGKLRAARGGKGWRALAFCLRLFGEKMKVEQGPAHKKGGPAHLEPRLMGLGANTVGGVELGRAEAFENWLAVKC